MAYRFPLKEPQHSAVLVLSAFRRPQTALCPQKDSRGSTPVPGLEPLRPTSTANRPTSAPSVLASTASSPSTNSTPGTRPPQRIRLAPIPRRPASPHAQISKPRWGVLARRSRPSKNGSPSSKPNVSGSLKKRSQKRPITDEREQSSEEDPDAPWRLMRPVATVAGLRENYGSAGGTHELATESFQLGYLFNPLA